VIKPSGGMRNTRQGPLGSEESDAPRLTATHGCHVIQTKTTRR